MKIFIGPVEVAGYCRNLRDGFRALGFNADFINYGRHPYAYGGDDNYRLITRIQNINTVRDAVPKKKILKKLLYLFYYGIVLIFNFFHAVKQYDVFIFMYGFSLLPDNRDLFFLKLLKKKIIFNVGFGSDLRPAYLNGALQSRDGHESVSAAAMIALVKKKKKQAGKIEKYAGRIIGAPYSSSFFLTKPFINWFALGIPTSITDTYADGPVRIDDRVVILHAPSHPVAKGTKKIQQVVGKLVKKGYHIDFRLISGKTNNEVIRELQTCDFVIDQLYSDTPLAGIATEAAFFSKPSVVGGYGLSELGRFIPEGMVPPSEICMPEDMEKAVEKLVKDREYRERLGKKAKAFVEKNWAPRIVAERYLRLMEGTVPAGWMTDPGDVLYIHGACQEAGRTKKNVIAIISRDNTAALGLDHNRALEQKLLNFANTGKQSY